MTDQLSETTTRVTNVRWGVLATGGIAATVSGDIALVPGAELAAVASRDAGRAAAFAAEHGVARSYGSYRELVEAGADRQSETGLDAVYIATPHAQHVALARACVEAGLPVLVEKPVGCTAAATRGLAELARERGVFVMEALWARFQPNLVRLRELLASGAIGEVRSVAGDLGFALPYDPAHRLWDPAQGGGTLLDTGVYPVSFAQGVFGGSPRAVHAVGVLAENGVDAEASLLLDWGGGRTARLGSTLLAHAGGAGTITGTKGRIEVAGPLHKPARLQVWADGAGRDDEPSEVVERPVTGRGYVHMVEHVHECLAAGLVESPVMPMTDSVAVAEVLDAALDQLGAVHRDDDTALA
ncbi:Gfo/Idh/MocA family oxidoreductase [Streptomyces sp. NP160]|uniref:Gfo/Idh/MocA family protein n=1 Tax=Streptomyces sp. NP160 TaxID=2586637 RepID=UPI00111B83A5|nr:Gfo/Idh/MocA family oxidoreductase [Streptomyces sp. NP160]TNM69087.1 Gfo/Idh/MocA family oxidoreductase [Streptomyces sp. NP160]